MCGITLFGSFQAPNVAPGADSLCDIQAVIDLESAPTVDAILIVVEQPCSYAFLTIL
jgi:hypothetical protein